MPSLPTVIVVHPRENRKKCSVEPLRGRDGFQFHTFKAGAPLTFSDGNYVRLGIGGPLLSPADSSAGLLVLDGTWRRAEAMEAQYSHVPIRSLPAWRTAYPRVSKVFEDPDQGLATIEAVWLAYWCLGRSTAGLLDHYRWGEGFLELNREFQEPAASSEREPPQRVEEK
jgi:pre-rRNA-processing protein TSR3